MEAAWWLCHLQLGGDTCSAPGIKYHLEGLTAGISLVFLAYQGSTFIFDAKTTVSRSINSHRSRHSPQLVQGLEDLLLGGQNRTQLLLSGRVHLKDTKEEPESWTPSRCGKAALWVCVCTCPGVVPAVFFATSSVTTETYRRCSSKIMASCRCSCLISRWIWFWPSNTWRISRSLTLSYKSSTVKTQLQARF